MKNSILVVISLIIFSNFANAQFSFGLSAGTGTGFVKMVSDQPLEHEEKTKMGYFGGLYARYDFAKYYVQVSPVIANKGNRVLSNSNTEIVADRIIGIYPSLSFGKNFIFGLRVYAGIGMDIAILYESETNDNVLDLYKDFYNLAGGSAYENIEETILKPLVGLSWEFSDFSVGLQYEVSLWPALNTDLWTINGPQDIDHYINNLFLTVGYKL